MLENGGTKRSTSYEHVNTYIFRCSLTYNIGGKNITAKGETWLKKNELKPLPTTSTTLKTSTEITTYTTNEEETETELGQKLKMLRLSANEISF